jgi:hypothetical protein
MVLLSIVILMILMCAMLESPDVDSTLTHQIFSPADYRVFSFKFSSHSHITTVFGNARPHFFVCVVSFTNVRSPITVPPSRTETHSHHERASVVVDVFLSS